MSDESRLHLLNGNGHRPPSKSNDLTSRKDVEQFVESFANNVLLPKVDEIIRHYMMQSPELVARMISDALKANGLELLPPNWNKPVTPQLAQDAVGVENPEPVSPADEVPPVTGA